MCRRRNYAAIVIALLAANWAYNSISFIVEYSTEVLRQVGAGYVVQACLALLLPFACMGFGLFVGRTKDAEPGAAPNGRQPVTVADSGAAERPPSVS